MFTKTSLFFLPLAPAIVSAGLLPRGLALDRRADICGVNGYDRDRGNYFWSASKQLASYSGCSARCARSTRCQSFGFNDEACMLFDLSLAENFDEDGRSDVKYFDAGCVREGAPTTDPTQNTTTSSLSRTDTATAVPSATRTITRSVALATGTGGPSRSTNGTGFFPVHRASSSTATQGLPHAPTGASSSSSTEIAAPTPTPTTDASAVESPSADATGDNSESTEDAGSQTNGGVLAPIGNATLANNGTSISPNATTVVLNGTDTV